MSKITSQTIHFIEPDEPTTTGWTLSVQIESGEVVFGMHWKDKPLPTHTFTVTTSDVADWMVEASKRAERVQR